MTMAQNNNSIIEEVYKNHREWLYKVSYNFAQSDEGARELIQDMFLYLLEMPNIEKIKYGNSVNLFYLYKIIKTRHLSNISPKKTFILLEEDFDNSSDEYDYASDAEFERRLAIVNKELGENSQISWFDRELFRVYHYENHSLTSLSQATKISRSACYNSIKKLKRTIKNKI